MKREKREREKKRKRRWRSLRLLGSVGQYQYYQKEGGRGSAHGTSCLPAMSKTPESDVVGEGAREMNRAGGGPGHGCLLRDVFRRD